jgi:hypothetical protein
VGHLPDDISLVAIGSRAETAAQAPSTHSSNRAQSTSLGQSEISTPMASGERNPLIRAASHLGRRVQPNQVTFQGGPALSAYTFEPAGRIDSQGYHAPGTNYSTLENDHIDYDAYRYTPITYALAPGQVNKGGPHLKTAIGYGTDKLFNREGQPARYPVPGWVRKTGEAATKIVGSVRSGRSPRPVPLIPTSAQTDGVLTSRNQLAARINDLFGVGAPDAATDPGIGDLLNAMDALGEEAYPVPAYQKQCFLTEALAVATQGNIAQAQIVIAQFSGGLDPVRARTTEHTEGLDAAERHNEEATWRTAQILAASGGDGFETLLKAGAVRRNDNTPSLPGEQEPIALRKQQALRVFLEATAQATESVPNGSARPSGLTLAGEKIRSAAARAALKLWTNPDAGNIGPEATVPDPQRLTRPEKNAYYEWTQGFGRPGADAMAKETRNRMHKLVTTWMDRAQDRGLVEGQPSRAALNPKRQLGMDKSPFTALQFGTRGSQLRYPSEIRTQYDGIVRPVLRGLEQHFDRKVQGSTDFNSLARNLIDQQLIRHWNQQATQRDGDDYSRRPFDGRFDDTVLNDALDQVKAILSPPADGATDPLSAGLRALVTDPAAVAALNIDDRNDHKVKFSLDHVAELVRREGIGTNALDDNLLKEFGLDTANRKNLSSEMTKSRLFGNDGTRAPTVQTFLDRARHIRDTSDELKPTIGADGSVITGLKEFNDTYIREEPMGPRIRAQEGGVYGLNNAGAFLNMVAVAVAPEARIAIDKRAFVEYNSGGHAFEMAFGVQKSVSMAAGLSAGLGTFAGDRLVFGAFTGTVGVDVTTQKAVRLRGKRELDERALALLVADEPGGPNHGRRLEVPRDDAGQQLMVDQDGRQAWPSDNVGGGTRYTYLDDNQVIVKTPAGHFTDASGKALTDDANSTVEKKFEKAYVFADDRTPAHNFARLEKPRYHLLQATDFVFEQAQGARTDGAGTPDQLWNRWVDTFFDNPNVSVSYQNHRNVGQAFSLRGGLTARQILPSGARPGGSVGIGRTERTYEALNRADQTGNVNRTIVQVGYSGFTSVDGSASVGAPRVDLNMPGTAITSVSLPSGTLGGVSATMADHGVLAAFRTVEIDGKIVPEFTYMDIEYRNIDLYKKYVAKNQRVWESFYGTANLDKHLEKLQRDAEPNQRFSERWRLSPEGAHKLRSYLTLAKIHHAASRRDTNNNAAEWQKIEAEAITKFAAEMLGDRNMWDPLGAYVVEVNSKERAVGANFFVQAQQVTRSVSDAELDWIGGSSAGMNNADRIRHERDASREESRRLLTGHLDTQASVGPSVPTATRREE